MPLVVLTDAQAHLDVLDTPGLLATATREGRLPPVIAVFIDAWPNRAEQLGVPGGQAAWIVEKLLPTLHRQGLTDPTTGEYWRIDPDPRRTILTGASFGGLTALFAFAEAPELCSSVSAQSVSLWRYQTGAFTEFLAAAASRVGVHNARVRLHAGRYEGDMASDAAVLTRALHDVANWTVLLVIHEGGHDWAWWQQAMLDDVTGFLNGKAYGDLDG
jgi:enterochelin esterase family protein